MVGLRVCAPRVACSANIYVDRDRCMAILVNDKIAISGGQKPEKPMEVFAKCRGKKDGASGGAKT